MEAFLVTGGAGFVGSNLSIGLKREWPRARVIALDNLKRRGAELNLPRLRDHDVEFVHGDIRSPEDLASTGPLDVIVECSAEPSVLAGYGDSPQYVVNTNLGGCVNCLELARATKAALIFLSTSRVYPMRALNAIAYHEGETRFELEETQSIPGISKNGISEAFPLEGTRSLYGATKLCSELLIQEYGEMYGLNAVINRCGVIAGPWQMGKADQGVAALWMARHVFGGNLAYIGYGGTGKQVRDFLHVDDLLRLVTLEIQKIEAFAGSVFNAGGGRKRSASLQELTHVCAEVSGNRIEIASEPENRVADVPIYITDNGAITQTTGWKPEKDLSAILCDTYQWMTEYKEQLRSILAG